MAVISYSELESALHRSDGASNGPDASPIPAAAPVVLIHGEEMLVSSALKTITEFFVPGDSRSVSYEPVDGSAGNLYEAVEKACTYPLLGARKVVALLDARLFDSKKHPGQLLKKVRDAVETQRLKRAAAYLLDFMAQIRIDLDDLLGSEREKHLAPYMELLEDSRWLDEAIAYCRQSDTTAAAAGDSAKLLERAIERGIPEGNRLILTTETVDRRKKLYELIKDRGLVVDCSVAQGQRQADKKAQEAVLQHITSDLLKKHSKTMEPGAFELLVEMTGFKPRTFSGSLEKLVTYTGSRRRISRGDVQAALERTKQDPIFAFTNAVTDRRTAEALFYLASLLHDPQQPLRPEQIVVSVLNQVRKLLRIKEFLTTDEGSVWVAASTFGHFKTTVLPAIAAHDRKLSDRIAEWHRALTDTGASDSSGRKAGLKMSGKPPSDLYIAPQPKNPYPVYQLFLKSEKFSLPELRQAVEHLVQADRRIKSGAENKQLILEELVWSICGGEDASDQDRLHHRPGK